MYVVPTRARKNRIVIGNKDLLGSHTGDAEFNRMMKVFRAFYQETYVVVELVATLVEPDFQFQFYKSSDGLD